MRESHLPHRNRANRIWGKKRQGTVETHLAGKRVIQAVRDLRQQGLGLRQIVSFLTKLGVPTKQRGVAWHPEMVKRILEGGRRVLPLG